jgi:hypothetical protein
MRVSQISTEKAVQPRTHLTMDTFKGLVYVKHGRVGTRSEGPDYYLQTTRGDFLLRYRQRNPWEPDYHLEFFHHRMVSVSGALDNSTITVKAIEEITAPLLPVDGVRQMKLIVGDSTTMDNVAFGFDGITEDSRCPTGTVCVWEGQAVAALWASHDTPGSGSGIEQFFLVLRSGHAELAVKTVLGKRFTLLDVEPIPTPKVRIDPMRYEITLQVENLGRFRPV